MSNFEVKLPSFDARDAERRSARPLGDERTVRP